MATVKLKADWYKTMKPLHFIHIPKTAGSSVRAWLVQRLGASALCPAWLWGEMVKLDRGKLPQYRAFSGHFGLGLADFLDQDFMTAVVIRNPLERTLSHYRHVLRDTYHPRHIYVARQSFEEFVKDASNWPMIENFQARYLVPSPIDFKSIANKLDDDENKLRYLSVMSEDARYLFGTNYVRETALASLEKIDIVGVTDRLSAFTAALAMALQEDGSTMDLDPPHENAADAQASPMVTPSDAALELIGNLTAIDLELYRVAQAR